ncbi:hypothetical protein [Streptomyces europaeiscabiei]|uniref:hypothetical protein n=1 Tax=Streptomyces europaeiscabiei TaxID=146819 RepID=UPI0029BE7F74|nr:hypothetical protein [Streptomyces europaeiscabiei]MDX3866865.1 hypothetical protein [Streptomyces europaeiscabiei]MDX3873107.1 hypothetical protein [Streptomyces europaeiscabiei]
MDRNSVVAALLSFINDRIVTHKYGDGLLADLPVTYSDGDSVRLLLEPLGAGVRVSDQASAYERLLLADVNTDTGRVAEAIATTIRVAGLANIGSEDDEIATFGPLEDLGTMMLAVAQASIRVEQLRWLAVRRAPVRFADKVVERVQSVAKRDWKVERNASLRLRSGRERAVTVAVETPTAAAYVQALSAKDKDQAAEHCYYLFSWADVPQQSRVAALDGQRSEWPSELLSELGSVADVEFFENQGAVESAIQRALRETATAH